MDERTAGLWSEFQKFCNRLYIGKFVKMETDCKITSLSRRKKADVASIFLTHSLTRNYNHVGYNSKYYRKYNYDLWF